ncbi:hypothetical protein GCM10022393_02750 [Aquimarina addita]|uniref:Outer membrane lipoprotein-sorting protein n=1 Tax=Aquimarina addita TaxID=870485 RepID=A0ABP7X8M1_9FLAO
MKLLPIFVFSVLLLSCNQKKKENISENSRKADTTKVIPVETDGGIGDGATSITDLHINTIETAHKKEQFLKHKIVSFMIDLSFGGKERLKGKITMFTNSTKIRIDKNDGTKLIYTGDTSYLCPAEANDKGARFDMFTWSYFFGFPYKLSDSGTNWEMQQDRILDKVVHSTAKLTFDEGVGDAPKDWYIVYTDPETQLTQAAAYIVTLGKDISKAEEDPHMIQYKEFTSVNGIPMSTKWEFYGWTSEKGKTEKIGEATISDITFLEDESDLFEKPANSKVIN